MSGWGEKMVGRGLFDPRSLHALVAGLAGAMCAQHGYRVDFICYTLHPEVGIHRVQVWHKVWGTAQSNPFKHTRRACKTS